MAFSFRRSKKIGPFRIGLSKGGLSLSTGVKGLRVGANSKGAYTSMSVPGTGIYATQYMKKGKNEKPQEQVNRTPAQPVDMKKVLRIVLIIILLPVIIPLSPVLLMVWLLRRKAK